MCQPIGSLLLPDTGSLVCDITPHVVMVHLIMLAKQVLQDAWVPAQVFHVSPKLFNC